MRKESCQTALSRIKRSPPTGFREKEQFMLKFEAGTKRKATEAGGTDLGTERNAAEKTIQSLNPPKKNGAIKMLPSIACCQLWR
jgi:hypothetical protein